MEHKSNKIIYNINLIKFSDFAAPCCFILHTAPRSTLLYTPHCSTVHTAPRFILLHTAPPSCILHLPFSSSFMLILRPPSFIHSFIYSSIFLFYSYITSWSLWLYLYSHIVDLYFLSISRISLEYYYDYIITISHCTFFYQEIRLKSDENSKVLRNRMDKEEYRYASRDKGLLSESLLCRPRMSPAENKRLEVHACFPLTAHCSFFLLHLNPYFLPISLLRHP